MQSLLSSDDLAFFYEAAAALNENHDQGDEDGGTSLRSILPPSVPMMMSRDFGGGVARLPKTFIYMDGL